MSIALLTLLALGSTNPESVRVSGIVASSAPGCSAAIFESEQRRRVAGVGEVVFGGRVTSIEAGRVTLDFGTGDVELRLEGSGVAVPPSPVAAPVEERGEEEAVAHIERAEVDRRLKVEMSRILSETQLRAVREGGAVRGLAVVRLPAGTLLSEVGLEPGDVITEVNGVVLDSMATLIGLWPRLQGATELRATVLRDGRELPLTVTLD
jgi:general secretion pathway protein C